MKQILLLFALFVPVLAIGQNGNATSIGKDEINRIKKDTDSYIFAETTMESEEEAKELACEFLFDYVEQWLEQNTDGASITEEELKEVTRYVVTARGPMSRVLAYVSKNKLPGNGSSPSKKDNEGDFNEDDGEYVSNTEKSESQQSEDKTDVRSDSEASEETAEAKPAPVSSSSVTPYESLVGKVMEVYTKDELMKLLYSEEMRECCRYGEVSAKTNTVSLAAAVLVIYSKNDGEIKAVLGPKNPDRINQSTQQKDSTTNYPKCGAIWLAPINN